MKYFAAEEEQEPVDKTAELEDEETETLLEQNDEADIAEDDEEDEDDEGEEDDDDLIILEDGQVGPDKDDVEFEEAE